MAVTYGFYNSINHDRVYDATQFSSMFDGIIMDGVFMDIGNHLEVRANSGMTITVRTGKAWFNHTWTLNDSDLFLDVPAASSLFPRTDAVVVEVNLDSSVRANSIKIVSGTAASNAPRPTMANTSTLKQYPLAYIRVEKSATAITQSKITNNIGTSSCPYITGPLKTINADSLISKWDAQWSEALADNLAEFQDWFDSLHIILDGDVAANMADAILEIQTLLNNSGLSTGPLSLSKGGTGAINAQNALVNLGGVPLTNVANKGSSTQPVWINNSGVAIPISYTIQKSVPSNAVFTDTRDLARMTGILGIGQGGTGATGVTRIQLPSISTGQPGYRFDSCFLRSYGKIVVLDITTINTPINVPSGEEYSLATDTGWIPYEYWPAQQIITTAIGVTARQFSSSAKAVASLIVSSDGRVKLMPLPQSGSPGSCYFCAHVVYYASNIN